MSNDIGHDTGPDDCTWPMCLPEDEQQRLCASIDASMRDEPDPHPYAGDPKLCSTDCTEKQKILVTGTYNPTTAAFDLHLNPPASGTDPTWERGPYNPETQAHT